MQRSLSSRSYAVIDGQQIQLYNWSKWSSIFHSVAVKRTTSYDVNKMLATPLAENSRTNNDWIAS